MRRAPPYGRRRHVRGCPVPRLVVVGEVASPSPPVPNGTFGRAGDATHPTSARIIVLAFPADSADDPALAHVRDPSGALFPMHELLHQDSPFLRTRPPSDSAPAHTAGPRAPPVQISSLLRWCGRVFGTAVPN